MAKKSIIDFEKKKVRIAQDKWIAREGEKIFTPIVQGMSHKFRTGLN